VAPAPARGKLAPKRQPANNEFPEDAAVLGAAGHPLPLGTRPPI